MSDSSKPQDQDVVVIEQRDKRSFLYIGISGLLGVALGGLIGSTLTAEKWQHAYETLNASYKQLEQVAQHQTVSTADQQRTQFEKLQEEFNAKLKQQDEASQKLIESLQQQVTLLEKQNANLVERIEEQLAKIEKSEQDNLKLNHQADLQSSMLERSRQVFQRELMVSQELERLEKEKNDLSQKLDTLKKECDDYLNGTNYNGIDDACVRQDEASARMSEIIQLIHVHQMDLKQIKALTEQMGM